MWNLVELYFCIPCHFMIWGLWGGGRGIMLRCSDRTPTTEQTQDKTNNYTKIHLKPLDKTKKCITGSLRCLTWQNNQKDQPKKSGSLCGGRADRSLSPPQCKWTSWAGFCFFWKWTSLAADRNWNLKVFYICSSSPAMITQRFASQLL